MARKAKLKIVNSETSFFWVIKRRRQTIEITAEPEVIESAASSFLKAIGSHFNSNVDAKRLPASDSKVVTADSKVVAAKVVPYRKKLLGIF